MEKVKLNPKEMDERKKEITDLLKKLLERSHIFGLEGKQDACICQSATMRNGYPEDWTLYEMDYVSIMNLFGNCEKQPQALTPCLIYQRLAIIDSLFTANVCRMRKFGLQEITNAIWLLCKDSKGNYTDDTLVTLAEEYVDLILKKSVPANNPIEGLLKSSFGWGKDKIGVYRKKEAVSLISKYLFFLLRSKGKAMQGFPIFDNVVRGMISKVSKYIGISVYGMKLSDFEQYTIALWNIIHTLNPAFDSICKKYGVQQFQLLDYLLWRMGKAYGGNSDPLLTKKEFHDIYVSNKLVLGSISVSNTISKLVSKL